jgi:hypothetical protein
VLKELVSYTDDATCDAVYLNVMKKRRESNLLRKKISKNTAFYTGHTTIEPQCGLITSQTGALRD